MTFRKSFFLLTFVLTLLSTTARAQFHLDLSTSSIQNGLGNDFFFAIPQNYEDQSGKYFYLYVTSPVATTVHVATAMGTMAQSISPYNVAAFNIPLGWEIKSTDKVEDKGVRVWSADGLSVSLMAHNPYTSDMTQILPIQSCGTDYIVASYKGLSDTNYDYPSEFVIASGYDKNRISITPSCDLRGEDSQHPIHPAGQQFFVTLNQWQSIQFKANHADSNERADATGTRVQSQMPVSVLAGAQCAQIPSGYSSCSHLLEMMSSIQNWGDAYYTAPSIGRPKGDMFLIVNTVANQNIYRYSDTEKTQLVCQPFSPFSTFWDSGVKQASHWSSDAPFYLVQYFTSATWDCSSCNIGDPSEMVVYPLSIGTKYFETPTSQGSQSPYINYVNLTVNRAAESTTTFDGKPVGRYTKLVIDSNYEIFRAANVSPGTHRLASDSATSCIIYGYGTDEAYGASVAPQAIVSSFWDSLAPRVTIDSGKICTKVKVTDVGSGIFAINDTGIVNLDVSFDSNQYYRPVVSRDSVTLCVIDTLKPASCVLLFTDRAGNRTIAAITRPPSSLFLDSGYTIVANGIFAATRVGDKTRELIATITDTSTTSLTVDSAWSSEPAFVYDRGNYSGTKIPFTLPSKGVAHIAFAFIPNAPGLYKGNVYLRTKEEGIIVIPVEGRALAPAAVQEDHAISTHNQALTDWLQKGSASFLLLPASPNPTTGILNITYGLREPANVAVAIFDLLGNRVYNFAFQSQSGLSQQSLDLRLLGSATYFYRVEASGQVQTGRFSIER